MPGMASAWATFAVLPHELYIARSSAIH
eukprot:COSAG01_NODE_69576_length_261_cov_0.617284_1_plen_27_part_10